MVATGFGICDSAISISEGTFSLISSLSGTTFRSLAACHAVFAALKVLLMSMATVIGPTPPGTGEM